MGLFALGGSYATTVRPGDDEKSKGAARAAAASNSKIPAATDAEESAVLAAVYAKETAVRPVEPTAAGDPFARMEYSRELRTQRVPARGGKVGSGCGIGTTEAADHGAARNTPT